MNEKGIPQKQAALSAEEISRLGRQMLETQETEISDTRLKIEAFKERIESGRKKDIDLLTKLEAQKDSLPGVAELIARHRASMKLSDEAVEAELTVLEAITARLEEGRATLQEALDELHTAQLKTLDTSASASKPTMQ